MSASPKKGRSVAGLIVKIAGVLTSFLILVIVAFPKIQDPPRRIRLVSPAGGQKWQIGSTQAIQWDAGKRPPPVVVRLSRDGGETWEELADLSKMRMKVCPWKVSGPASADCIVRVTDLSTASLDTSGVFEIVEPVPPRQPHSRRR